MSAERGNFYVPSSCLLSYPYSWSIGLLRRQGTNSFGRWSLVCTYDDTSIGTVCIEIIISIDLYYLVKPVERVIRSGRGISLISIYTYYALSQDNCGQLF